MSVVCEMMTLDSAERILTILQRGLRPDDLDALRQLLGAPEGATDAALARAVLQQLWTHQPTELGLRLPAVVPEDPAEERPSAADSSFLGRLATKSAATGMDVGSLQNVDTVCAVALAGTLRQRRAAIMRLSTLIQTGKRRADLRQGTDFLDSLRDVELAYELTQAKSKIPGAPGKGARAELVRLHRRGEQLRRAIQAYWEGRRDRDPLFNLLSEERAFLFVRLRALPDPVVAHVGSLLEQRAEAAMDARVDLLTSLRHAGDVRLSTRLMAVIGEGSSLAASEAARVAASIDDPRLPRVLRVAFNRSVDDRHRLVVAGALLAHGDAVGLESLVSATQQNDPDTVRLALVGLAELPTVDNSERLRTLVTHDDPRLRRQAIRTLARVGGGPALEWLRKHAENATSGALHGEREDAERTIVARLELLGEEVPAAVPSGRNQSNQATLRPRRPQAPLLKRLMARWFYLSGWLWWLVGLGGGAVRRFERAAKRYPGWILPHLAVGMVQSRRDEHGQALASFRRALEADRPRVERRPLTMRALSTAFLRRASELEAAGRADIARGLLEEVLAIDLRNAPSAVRFELQRRHEAHRRRALSASRGR